MRTTKLKDKVNVKAVKQALRHRVIEETENVYEPEVAQMWYLSGVRDAIEMLKEKP